MNQINPQQNNYGGQCDNKEDCITDFKASYTLPGHPIAYSGINKIHEYYKPYLTISDIEQLLSEVESYSLHKEFHNLKRNPSYSHYKRYQFQCDLVDIRSLAKYNDGVNYLLTCIDTFTRYAFVRLLRTKQGPTVLAAFKSILQEAVQPPKIVVLDRGTEFYNQHFQDYCRNNNITLFSPDSSIHAAYIERFNRTLQSLVYKHMTENETRRFIDKTDDQGNVIALMPLLVQSYNGRKHRMIGTSPYIAENYPNSHLEIRKRLAKYYETIRAKKVRFQVGNYVRIIKLAGKFDRGYNERAKQEIFKIHAIKTNLKIPMYTLSNYNGDEIIKGNFYAHELTKVTGDNFRIEKVLKKRNFRGNQQLFVKWKGFDDTHNSWIDASQVTKRFQN